MTRRLSADVRAMNARKPGIYLGILLAGLFIPASAQAYVGPGAGLSAIGTFIAVVGAVFLLVVGFVWYPVRRILRKKKAAAQSAESEKLDKPS